MKKILLLVFLFFNACAVVPSNREMICLIDCSENIGESLEAEPNFSSGNPDGVGAITSMFLIALSQEAAPILVSDSVWHNVAAHKALFDDFVSIQDINTLFNKYKQYERFKTKQAIIDFSTAAKYFQKLYDKFQRQAKQTKSKDALVKALIHDPVFLKKNAPAIAQDINSPLWQELSLYLFCSVWPQERYTVRKIQHLGLGLYLFLPRVYLNNIEPNYVLKQDLKDAAVTPFEKKLGLKIEHMTPAELIIPQKSNISAQDIAAKCADTYLGGLAKIFVSKQEAPDLWWALFISGHGTFYQSSVNQLKKYKADAAALAEKIKVLQNTKLNLEELLQKEPDNTRKQELQKSIEANQQDIKQAYQRLASANGQIKKTMAEFTIAGLSVEQFQKMLLFFNNIINTSFLVYISCYSGGSHFIDPYKIDDSQLIALKYPVVSGALAESPVYGARTINYLTWFNKAENPLDSSAIDKIIYKHNKNFTVGTNYDFVQFFKELRQAGQAQVPYKQLLSYVNTFLADSPSAAPVKPGAKHTTQISSLSNIPSIRFPGTHWFNVIDIDNKIYALTNVRAFVQNNKPLVINQTQAAKKEAILLYPGVINFDLVLNTDGATELPAFISMIPGKAQHVLEAIKAPKVAFSDILKSFFSLSGLDVSKLFTVKKITCLNNFNLRNMPIGTEQTFTDVVIFINAYIDKEFVNGVFFMGANNTLYSVEWSQEEEFPDDFAALVKRFGDTKRKDAIIAYFADAHKQVPAVGQFLPDEAKNAAKLEINLKKHALS